MEKVTIHATIKDLREKAVWLETIDNIGQPISIWLQRRYCQDNGNGTWTICKKPLEAALKEAVEYRQRQHELKFRRLKFKPKTWGLCKNGSYWLQTKGWSSNLERVVFSELAFVKTAEVNDDGTLSVRLKDALDALDYAQSRTNLNRTGYCDIIDFVGVSVNPLFN